MKLLPIKQDGGVFTLVYLPDGHEEPRIEVFDLSHDTTTSDDAKAASLAHEVSLRFPDATPVGPLEYDAKATYRDADGKTMDAKKAEDAFVALATIDTETLAEAVGAVGFDFASERIPDAPEPEPAPRTLLDKILGR